MQDFIARYQHTLIASTGALALVAAFYTGYLQGNRASALQPVTLSCKGNVLDKLSIPVEALARGVVAHAESGQSSSANAMADTKGKFVGSKNSTKYYAPSCGAVKRIKPANYIWFDNAEDAQLQGYTPGKC